MDTFAQTHLQLYRELQEAGSSEQDLQLVDRAYRLAMQLFAGHYRPNNKPFLAHLVGVASILVHLRQPAGVVAAGLLHSAYSLGPGRKGGGIEARYRKQVSESLGEDVEQLIYAYSSRRWSVQDFKPGAATASATLTTADRQLYLIKLADIHEEFLDDGYHYQPRKKLLWDENADGSWLENVAALMADFGYDSWSRAFRQATAASRPEPAAALRGSAASSYMLTSGWSASRFRNRLVRWLSRL